HFPPLKLSCSSLGIWSKVTYSPHCLKKKGTPAFLQSSLIFLAQSGCIGLALEPLSPPTTTQCNFEFLIPLSTNITLDINSPVKEFQVCFFVSIFVKSILLNSGSTEIHLTAAGTCKSNGILSSAVF